MPSKDIYQNSVDESEHFSGSTKAPNDPIHGRGIDTGKGVLLYNIAEANGKAAYDSFLQHCADHFFDATFNVESLKFYDLPVPDSDLILERIHALNFNFNHKAYNFSIQDLVGEGLYNSSILQEGTFVKQYDMRPTSENYAAFISGEPVRFHVGNDAFNIALLDHIARNGFPAIELTPT